MLNRKVSTRNDAVPNFIREKSVLMLSPRLPAASYLYLNARPYKAYWRLNEWYSLAKGRKLAEAILSDLVSRHDVGASASWVIQWIQWTGQAFVVPNQRSLGNRVVVAVGPP